MRKPKENNGNAERERKSEKWGKFFSSTGPGV
jgi:hypothetical protein